MRAAVARAAETAALRGLITAGPFHAIPRRPALPRNRADVTSASLRKPEMPPPAGIDAPAARPRRRQFRPRPRRTDQAAAREFGFSATSAQLRAVLAARIDTLTAAGSLAVTGVLLIRPPPPPREP
jgi:hypothetical protein